jgi:hypothetical protein
MGESGANRIALFKGEYKIPLQVGKTVEEMTRAYFLYYDHYSATKRRSASCTAGLRFDENNAAAPIDVGKEPCPACHFIDNDVAGNISRRRMHVFNAFLLGYFHQVDSDRKSDSGVAYKDWVECAGKRCKHCGANVERIFGRRVFWPLSPRFVKSINAYSKSEFSTRCRCGGNLEKIGLDCPECREILYDFVEDRIDDKEIAQLSATQTRCPGCKEVVVPKLTLECDECKKPTPLTLWDVEMKVVKVGTGTDTAINIVKWEPISDKVRELVSKQKPFDFGRLFKKMAPNEMAKLFGIPNPYEDEDTKSDRKHVDWDEDEDDDGIKRKAVKKRRHDDDDDDDDDDDE